MSAFEENQSEVPESSEVNFFMPNGSLAPRALVDAIPGLGDACKDYNAVDLMVSGSEVQDDSDGILNSIFVLVDKNDPSNSIDRIDNNQSYILIRDQLQNIKNYRAFLASAFAKLEIGGWLVITVPHQFLSDRKYRLPSRYGSKAFRFYTPSSLLAEIEEAIDPTEYRVRFLKDDDDAFTYDKPIDERAEGRQRIIVALQRLARPFWANDLMVGDDPQAQPDEMQRADIALNSESIGYVITPSAKSGLSIVAMKLDHRGDFLLANMAFKEMRERFADAHITLICGSWNVAEAKGSGFFDDVIPFDFFAEDASLKREPDRNGRFVEFRRLMKGRVYDVAVDFRFFEDTRPLLKIIDAEYYAGFDRWNAFPWLDMKLDLQSPSIDGRSAQRFIPASQFHTFPENHRHAAIVFDGETVSPDRPFIWGPYQDFQPGKYEIEFSFQPFDDEQALGFDLCGFQGTSLIAAGALKLDPREPARVNVEILEPANAVEIRFYSAGGAPLKSSFAGVRIRKLGEIVGMHQREAMYLLTQLVTARMSSAYRVETVSQ